MRVLIASLVPVLGAVQWVAGVALALLAIDRGRRYGGSGFPPRALARIAVVVFLVSLVVLALAATPASRFVGSWFPPEFTTRQWQRRTLFQSSVIGWLLLALAAVWNGVLGIRMRRRTAAAELRRRTARALTYRPESQGDEIP